MHLDCQKEKFSLDPDITYLNCAYMSPNLKAVEEAGFKGIRRKSSPWNISAQDFFEPVETLKKSFSRLINAKDSDRIALLPSASYGLANVAHAIKPEGKKKIVILEEQFPSNYYIWERLANQLGLHMEVISPPRQDENRGKQWNEQILEGIDADTLLVALSHVHWADGTLFDLKAIRKRTSALGALLIIDGTQSVGALPFDIQEYQPDALICASYKWLLGPYSSGLAYYGPYFDSGLPIEESWLNRLNSEDFQHLVNYHPEYKPKAHRYNVGEHCNFINVPMQQAALQQLMEWGVDKIQTYCDNLIQPALTQLSEMGCLIEEKQYRSSHLFGIRLPDHFDRKALETELKRQKILVSLRGNAIRVAPHLYNDPQDMAQLVGCFELAVGKSLSDHSKT